MIKVGIAGASGYTGIELCKHLLSHSSVTIARLYSQQYAGQTVIDVCPAFHELSHLVYESFDSSEKQNVDVLFLALPHGLSHKFMPELISKNPKLKIVDLSADYRLSDPDLFEKYYNEIHKSPELLKNFVLGFPEFNKKELKKAQYCASPGCYPTATILGAYPLSQAGLVKKIVVDAKSGVSGAGKSLKVTSLYGEAADNLSAYGTGTHRHSAEMEMVLGVPVLFSPHLAPMFRGILSSIYIDLNKKITLTEIDALFEKTYKDAPFVTINNSLAMPSTKYVKGTNHCIISYKYFEKMNLLVVFSAIDNLVKGASGQAIQNMNLMCGFDELDGLKERMTL